jgi:phytoene desaturase
MKKRIAVIGAGFSGMAAAAYLAHNGMEVTVYEKNGIPGGRAGLISENGFRFDMGPTWYWMPDVFERFFATFGKSPADYYSLKRLDPSYKVWFGKNDSIEIPASVAALTGLFEKLEPGSGKKLEGMLKDAEYKYDLGIKKLVYKPSISAWEFFESWMIRGLLRMDFVRSVSTYVHRLFKDPRLVRILEFPVIFLGAKPSRIPSMYTLMNYADQVLGTWYPVGGMYEVVKGMHTLASDQGARFQFNAVVESITVSDEGIATGLVVNKEFIPFDFILGSADYHHIESSLLPAQHRSYSERYWNTRTMAPSAILFYLGLNKKLPSLKHHNLFFDTDFAKHVQDIYDKPKWPENPALYISCASKTDPSVAPEGHENCIVLIPVAAGLEDTPEIRDQYLKLFIDRLKTITGEDISGNIVFQRSYAQSNFIYDYNSFKGNAYGLANTLRQTALFKPSLRSAKVENLFYAGQLTVPGPGVPSCIISGQVAATELLKRI